MVDKKDDQALNEYLRGDSDLSRQYRAVQKDMPPEHLDNAIRAAARKSAGTRPRLLPSFMQQWGRPLKYAAVIVICVSLVMAIYDEEGHMILTDSDRTLPDTAPLKTGDKSDQSLPAFPAEFTDEADKNGDMTGGRPDSVMTGGKMIREKKKQTDTRDALQNEPGVPPTQNRLEEESLDLMQEQQAPVLKREMTAPGTMEEKFPASSITPAKAEEDWLLEITQLWQSGERELAIARLAQFLETYPDYPHDELLKQLPEDFNPAEYIKDFEPD